MDLDLWEQVFLVLAADSLFVTDIFLCQSGPVQIRGPDTTDDAANDTRRSAEHASSDNPDHPQAETLTENIHNIREALDKQEQEELEDLTLSAMRILAQIESGQ